MNIGAISGATPNTWLNYDPVIKCAGDGAVTQPDIGTGGHLGRWIHPESNLIIVQLQIGFSTGFSAGSGACYVISLPVRAARPWAGPVVIGQALRYKTVTATPYEMFTVATLADPWTSLGAEADNYFQLYMPHSITSGTGTWSSGASSVTVTHNCPVTPDASDIEFGFTSAQQASGNLMAQVKIDTITSTQFTARTMLENSIGTNNVTYSWRVRAEPKSGTSGSWLLGPGRPWPDTFAEVYFCQLYYEAA